MPQLLDWVDLNDPLTQQLAPGTTGVDLTLSSLISAVSGKINGLNIGSLGQAISTTDGMLRFASGPGAGLGGRILAHDGSYQEILYNALTHRFQTSGSDALRIHTTGDLLIGSTIPMGWHSGNRGLQLGGSSGLTYGTSDGAVRISSNVSRQLVGSQYVDVGNASLLTLAKTGLQLHTADMGAPGGSITLNSRMNITESSFELNAGYDYRFAIANTERLRINNTGSLEANMASSVAEPMLRLTRADASNNHIEMLGSSTVAKAHIGSLGDVMYLGANAYHNGTTWASDNTGRAAARIQLHAASGSGYIGLYATNTNNAPAADEVARVISGGVQIQSGFRLGLMIDGAEYASHRLIWHGQINHGGNSGALNGGHAGLYLVRIQQTSIFPYYNMALVLAARDGYNGSSSMVVAQTVTGTAHQLYAGGDVGLRWIDGGGGSGPSLHNASGQNLQVTVYELAVNY